MIRAQCKSAKGLTSRWHSVLASPWADGAPYSSQHTRFLACRFIEDQKVRLTSQRAGKRDSLPCPSRHGAWIALNVSVQELILVLLVNFAIKGAWAPTCRSPAMTRLEMKHPGARSRS